jgi:hypothetical protein
MALRLLSGIPPGRMPKRHRGEPRRGPGRVRGGVEGVPVEPHGSGLPGMARPTRLDCEKVCAMGRRQTPGAAEPRSGKAVRPVHEVPLRRGLRHVRAGGIGAARAAHQRGVCISRVSKPRLMNLQYYKATGSGMPLVVGYGPPRLDLCQNGKPGSQYSR